MALINSIMPSFYGGVSQQTDEIKLDNQCQEMINCVPSIAQGLQRRNPAKIFNEIESINVLGDFRGDPYLYTYDRGDNYEKYLIVVWSGLWHVYDMNGILLDAGYDDYLICQDPYKDIECMTIKDTTYILNKTKKVGMIKLNEDYAIDDTPPVENAQYKYTPYVGSFYIDPYRSKPTEVEDTGYSWDAEYGTTTNYDLDVTNLKVKCTLNVNGTNYYGYSAPVFNLHKRVDSMYFEDHSAAANEALDNAISSHGGFTNGSLYSETTENISVYFTVEATTLPTDATYEGNLVISYYVGGTRYLPTNNVQFGGIEKTDRPYVVGVRQIDLTTFDISDYWSRQFFYWVKQTDPNYPFTYTLRTNSPDYTGTATLYNNAGDLTDNTKNWLTNNLVGFTLHNKTRQWKGEIISNTATTIETAENSQIFNIGDEYEIMLSTTSDDSEEVVLTLSNKINGLGDTNFQAQAIGSVLKVDAPTNVKIYGSDSFGNTASESWHGEAASIEDLPQNLGFENTIIEITGNENNDYDNYYVIYQEGIYKETYKPGTRYALDPLTMPHKLIRGLDVNGISPIFYFMPNDGREEEDLYGNKISTVDDVWSGREVGDTVLAADPSFVNEYISSMFTIQNRLGFLSNENVILSETNNYYNFFPTTVIDLLDTDNIDLSVDIRNTLKLRAAIPYQKDILLFGDTAQFTMSFDGVLSANTLKVQQSTSYNYNFEAKPCQLGPNVYFTTNTDNFSKVREYYVVPDTTINDANNISIQVPQYITKNIKKIVGTSTYDMIFFLSRDNPNELFVYNFLWTESEKTQSAWHKWTFIEDIVNIEILEDKLFIMFNYGEDYTIKTIDLELPEDFTTVTYADHVGTTDGEGDIYALYETKYTFNHWSIPTGKHNIDDFRRTLKLKNIEISSAKKSYYNLSSIYINRGNFIVNKDILLDKRGSNKFRMGGYMKDMEITVSGYQDKGFKLTSAIFEGSYNSKSRGV